MKTKLLIFVCLMALLAPLQLRAGFVVRSVKGSVSLSKGGEQTPLKVGMKVSPADKVTIGAGSSLSVINDVNNSIYTSVKEGTFTLSRMMLDAKVESDSNFSTINNRLKVGGGGGNRDQRVYVEQGMVKRTLTEYDPQASGLTIDPATLARCLKESAGQGAASAPFESSLNRGSDNSLSVELVNRAEFPVYFNIISRDKGGVYALSCLGQPAGSYILLPSQGLMRNNPGATDPELTQILIAANCSFDVDALLDALNKEAAPATDPIPEFPLYLLEF